MRNRGGRGWFGAGFFLKPGAIRPGTTQRGRGYSPGGGSKKIGVQKMVFPQTKDPKNNSNPNPNFGVGVEKGGGRRGERGGEGDGAHDGRFLGPKPGIIYSWIFF